MRILTVVAVAHVGLVACGVEPVSPPQNLVADANHQAPPPPPDIRDDPACKLFRWPLSAPQAAELLKRAETFADTGIYYGGEPPPQMAAFNVLLDQPDAVRWFDDIAATGGKVGRLYALCAFQLLDSARATKLAAELRADHGQVFAQFGCTGMHDAISDLVNFIETNSYGKYFRKSRERTYKYFSGPANICMQATAGVRHLGVFGSPLARRA